jgi:hypothetical protein
MHNAIYAQEHSLSERVNVLERIFSGISGYPTSVNSVNTPSGSSENDQNNNSWFPSVATYYWLIHKGALQFSVR